MSVEDAVSNSFRDQDIESEGVLTESLRSSLRPLFHTLRRESFTDPFLTGQDASEAERLGTPL